MMNEQAFNKVFGIDTKLAYNLLAHLGQEIRLTENQENIILEI